MEKFYLTEEDDQELDAILGSNINRPTLDSFDNNKLDMLLTRLLNVGIYPFCVDLNRIRQVEEGLSNYHKIRYSEFLVKDFSHGIQFACAHLSAREKVIALILALRFKEPNSD